ncbi:MAG: glycoside hydrolase family 99-like domain-containing protein [Bacteroidetes bacterium]|nr:glycoside hydrolase family 99-like domain-containing protein [Bacteroidota bacterium]
MKKKARLIAFYLPQYYPIPENDNWHGKGFTEWTNVTKAKPLFKGHYQPILPADLGFYDLRVSETRMAQAQLAKEYGVEAFCYWHYWFGNGKRILDQPFHEVLKSKQPDFPFCLAWANASWTGIWYGMSNNTLLKQEYPGKEDYIAHFYAMLDAFKDERYLTVNGKRLFFIYSPHSIPNVNEFTTLWQDLAEKEGINSFYFIGATHLEEEPVYDGFMGSVQLAPFECLNKKYPDKLERMFLRLSKKGITSMLKKSSQMPRKVHEYIELLEYLNNKKLKKNELPLIMPNWDNTARSGLNGSVLTDSSPELFSEVIKNAIKKIDHIHNQDERIIFVQAWNEWAEGNYLEPDRKFGHGYLKAIKKNIFY